MFFAKSLVLLCSLNFAFSQKKKDFTCVPMDVCQCMFQNGLGINLHGLNVTFDTTESYIIFHPCSNIAPPDKDVFVNHTVALNECKEETSLCLYRTIDLKSFKMINLGLADSFKFQTSIDGKKISLVSKYNSWTTNIFLQCSPDADPGTLSVTNLDYNSQKIDMSLVSKRSCLTAEFSDIKLAGWAVVLIVICTVLLVYFVGGALFLRFFFGAQGVEMIPHYQFWNRILSRLQEIPVLSSCCRSSHGYDEI